MTNLHERMLPDPRLSACQVVAHPTELPARQSWTKHFTCYNDVFLFLWGAGRVRGFMVLQNYFTYFELNQSLCWAKSKDPYGKKKKKNIRSPAPSIYIYQSNISGLFPSDFSLWFSKASQFKSKVLIFVQCDFQNSITASLLFTNPDFSGWDGRLDFFFLFPVQVKNIILRLNCF